MTITALAIARLAFGLLLPTMRAELDLSLAQAGNVGTAVSFGYFALVLPAGLIASRYGPRIAIIAGLILTVSIYVQLHSGFGNRSETSRSYV